MAVGKAEGEKERAEGEKERAEGEKERAVGEKERVEGEKERAEGGKAAVGTGRERVQAVMEREEVAPVMEEEGKATAEEVMEEERGLRLSCTAESKRPLRRSQWRMADSLQQLHLQCNRKTPLKGMVLQQCKLCMSARWCTRGEGGGGRLVGVMVERVQVVERVDLRGCIPTTIGYQAGKSTPQDKQTLPRGH